MKTRKKFTMTLLFACAFALVLSLGSARAQPAKDTEGFEPVKSGDMMMPGESIPAVNLVAAAYAFIWASVLVYVISVARSSRRIEHELAALRKRIEG